MAVGEPGEAYRLQGDYARALADLDRAIELNPKYDWAFAQRGVTYRLQGDYVRALADFDRAIELDPKYDQAFAQRGVTYRLQGDYVRAWPTSTSPLNSIRSMTRLLPNEA